MKIFEILLLNIVGMIQLIVAFSSDSQMMQEMSAHFMSARVFVHYSNVLALQVAQQVEYAPDAAKLLDSEVVQLRETLNEMLDSGWINPYLTARKIRFYDTFKSQA